MDNNKVVEKSDVRLITKDYQTKINTLSTKFETMNKSVSALENELTGINQILTSLEEKI